MLFKSALPTLVLACAVLVGPTADAADSSASPAPAAAPAVPSPPSPAAIAAADQLLIIMGVKESIANTVPAMMTELEKNVTTTRPEIRDSLRQTLTAIKPDFDKSAMLTYEKAEALLALAMSEKELVDVAAFFASPTGKKYLAIQPLFLQKLQDVVVPWRDGLSTDIVTKAREEMKKKGVDF